MRKTTFIYTVLAASAAAIIAAALPVFADDHGASPGGPPPAMPVSVAVMEKKPLNIWTSYSGRTHAIEYVDIRPEVDGRIEEVKFEDGAIVQKGDVLFVIDPRPYEAAMEEASAAVEGAKSQNDLAEKELKRAEELVKTGAVSKRVFDERQNAAQVAKNALNAAQAMFARAEINLDRAYLKAPVSGRISRPEITVGNVVQAGANAPVLATIVSNEGIYADFEIDEQTYLRDFHGKAEKVPPVRIFMGSSDSEPVCEGKIKSFDNRINTASGTIRARAFCANGDEALLPGMFITASIGSASSQDAITLTEQAIGTDQNRKFVYVVGSDNKVVYRPVTIGASVDGRRIITAGLEEGEKVIVENTMKIHPGMEVVPQVQGDKASEAAALSAASGGE